MNGKRFETENVMRYMQIFCQIVHWDVKLEQNFVNERDGLLDSNAEK